MADQIKNENVGEVSSPATEEKKTAPNTEPAFGAPQSKNETAKDTVADNTPKEARPERKLPVSITRTPSVCT